MLNFKELKQLLDSKVLEYNTPDYIDSDPIQVPHSFSKVENIEIASFLSSTIAWGNRKMIINNARRIVLLMDNDPFDFIMNAESADLKSLNHFAHRTFNGVDLQYFALSLKNIYFNHGGLAMVFEKGYSIENNVQGALRYFRKIFFELQHETRTEKHIANIDKNSSCKRLNMMLRWLVRKDENGVDFGLWNFIPMSALYIPLDLHVGNIARQLGILTRNQNDWKAVVELQQYLQKLDPDDPCKYDFALFGMGVFS